MEDRMIEEVRVELLKIKQSQGLTTELLASRIKKENGERYHPQYVSRFLQNEPGRDWSRVAAAAAVGWRIGRLETRLVRRVGGWG